jgi:hypothetical protein
MVQIYVYVAPTIKNFWIRHWHKPKLSQAKKARKKSKLNKRKKNRKIKETIKTYPNFLPEEQVL